MWMNIQRIIRAPHCAHVVWLDLVARSCLDHNDSSVHGVTSTPRWSPFPRKESTHEDKTPPYDAPPPTHGARHATPQLLCADDARLSARRRRLRPAFSYLARAPRPGTCAHL